MNVALTQPVTVAEFLAWEDRQELRWEFDGFSPIAMTGGTFAHAAIQRNLITALTNRLRGKPCQPIGSDFKLVAAGSVRYPDAMVICHPVAPRDRFIDDPVVVFEVLSTSTASTDRIIKNREYRDTPSVRRYVLLEQDQPAATMFERVDNDWIGHLLTAEATLSMPEIGIAFPLAELFEGLVFEESSTSDE